jgi:putative transposase
MCRIDKLFLKYPFYLHEMTDGFVAKQLIDDWMGFYNTGRPHSALDGNTPQEACWAINQDKMAA